jgi:predicted enzyme related to lactoylglutathione lyase
LAARVRHITIDCADPYGLASFWSAIVGAPVADDDEPGDTEVLVEVSGGPSLLFVRVPEAKRAKNRVHLDLQPIDRDRDDEVDRALTLGATVVSDHRRDDGGGWVTLADPEGNEFCVELSFDEQAPMP